VAVVDRSEGIPLDRKLTYRQALICQWRLFLFDHWNL